MLLSYYIRLIIPNFALLPHIRLIVFSVNHPSHHHRSFCHNMGSHTCLLCKEKITSSQVVPACNRCGLSRDREMSSCNSDAQLDVQRAMETFLRLGNDVDVSIARIVTEYLLWFRAPTDWARHEFVDARDQYGEWLVARVESQNDEKRQLILSFPGFTSKWNMLVSMDSPDLSPLCTRIHLSEQARFVAWLRSKLGTESSDLPLEDEQDLRLTIFELVRALKTGWRVFSSVFLNLSSQLLHADEVDEDDSL